MNRPLQTSRVEFRRGHRLILDGVDVTVDTGSLTAIVGPNGSGKSTLLHLIAAADTPSSGEVLLDGAQANRMPRRDRARFTALVEQQAETDLDLTVFDVVLLGRTPHIPLLGAPDADDRALALEALEWLEATSLAERRFRDLSGGERQRVLIARALTQQPRLLLADEPTNHLDIHAQLHTLSTLRALANSGMAVFTAMHDLTLAARYADQVIVLNDGRVVSAGAPAQTLTPQLIADVYQVHADILTHPADGSMLIAFSG